MLRREHPQRTEDIAAQLGSSPFFHSERGRRVLVEGSSTENPGTTAFSLSASTRIHDTSIRYSKRNCTTYVHTHRSTDSHTKHYVNHYRLLKHFSMTKMWITLIWDLFRGLYLSLSYPRNWFYLKVENVIKNYILFSIVLRSMFIFYMI